MFNDLIGIPHVYGGRSFDGIDCWGLSILAFGRFGITIPDYDIACSALKEEHFLPSSIGKITNKFKSQWQYLKEPEAPCIVAMSMHFVVPDAITHLGVYIGEGKFIHIMEDVCSSIAKIHHPFFVKKIKGFYRYVG